MKINVIKSSVSKEEKFAICLFLSWKSNIKSNSNMFAKIVTMEYKKKNNTAVGSIIPADNPKNAVISINKISITTIINENESNSILIGLKR